LDLEYRIKTKKGRQKWVLDKTQLIEEKEGVFSVIGALQDITDSKEATIELDQSKRYLDSIIDNLPIGLQIFDEKGDRVRINEKQKLIFSSNQLSLKKGKFNILQDRQSKIRGSAKVYQGVYKNKKAINHEIALDLNRDSSTLRKEKIYLQEIIFPILRDEGSVHSVVSLSTDITTRIVAEKALKASERYQKVLLKIIPDLIFVFTEEGVFKAVYTEEENLVLPLDSFLGKPFSEVFPGELSNKFYKNLKLATSTREVQSYTYEMEINGVTFSYETRLLTSIDNEVVAIIRDITDSINAERALKDSEEKFRELAERTQDALVLISATNEILYVSPNLFDILGISQQLYVKNPLNALKLIHKDDRHWVIPELNNYRKGKQKALDLQFRVVLDKGLQKWIWYRESTVFDDKNNALRYAAVITDITENKAVEEELKIAKEEAEKANRSKSAFLANISHEIRTPMNAVLGFSDLLYSRIKDPVLKGYLDSIKSSGNTLLNLLNDILDLSKIEAQKMTIIPSPINLHDILGEIKHIFSLRALEKGLDYKFEIDEELPRSMLLDELRIKQILLNLVDNAIKFTEKGDIRIVVRHLESTKRKNRVDLLIDVEDTGIGVPYHLQQSIFDSFRQQDDQDKKKFQGTGLGLAITKRLVELCNGEINLESHPGMGSKFAVRIKEVKVSKKSEKSSKFPKRKLRLENSVLRGKVIVLIDREKSNRELIKEVFFHSKSKVIQGENVSTLISLANKKIDLIVLEISSIESLRADLNAIESIKKFVKIPKIGISSISKIDEEFSRKFIALFTKPIDLPDLVEVVSSYFQIDDFNKIDRANSEKIIGEVDRKVVSAVIELLEQKHYPEWEAALTTSSFSEIENFANSIKRLGLEYNFKSLQTFSDVLVMHAKNFDIDKMNDVLKSFPLLISELRSTL
jgi:PAS domain S-box-containing protein